MTYNTAFTTSVKNKDGAIDLLFAHAYGSLPSMLTGGYLRDLRTMEALNLEADYWNLDYMEEVAVTDKVYLGYNDFCIPSGFTISFNKTMMEQYRDATESSVYDMVYDYKWTVDQMISLANLVYIDQTNDGKTADDTFGMTGEQWINFIPFVHASNMQLMEQDEKGDYVVSVYHEKNQDRFFTLVQKMKEFTKGNSAWFRYRTEPTALIPLTSDRALMSLTKVSQLDSYLSYDIDFGVLPYPMYDEAQKDVGYRTWNYDGNLVAASYLRNEQMVGETMELLAFYASPVRVAVMEKMLGKQIADTPDDAAMLNIIWDGLCSDVGLTYAHNSASMDSLLYCFPWLTNPNGNDEVSSYIAGLERSCNKAMRSFIVKLQKVEEKIN